MVSSNAIKKVLALFDNEDKKYVHLSKYVELKSTNSDETVIKGKCKKIGERKNR